MRREYRLTGDAIARYGGHVYKAMGDGMCAAFPRAADAIEAARLVRRQISAASWPTTEALRVRIAIAQGDADLRRGDYFGQAINLVSRLLSLCRGGETLLAGDVATACDGASADIKRHGWYRLKGIAEPIEVAEASDGTVRTVHLFGSARGFQPALTAAGLSSEEAGAIVTALDGVLDFRRCRPDDELTVERDAAGALLRFQYRASITQVWEGTAPRTARPAIT